MKTCIRKKKSPSYYYELQQIEVRVVMEAGRAKVVYLKKGYSKWN